MHFKGMQHGPLDRYIEYDDFHSFEYESYPRGLVINSSCILKDHLHMNYILKENLAMDHFHEDQLHVHILVVDGKDHTI
jgi:hypothetical protein